MQIAGKNISGGFVAMVMSIIGLVLYVTIFNNILTAIEAVRIYTYISTFTALSTVVQIAPTVLLLGGVLGAGFAYYKGYKMVGSSGTDASGLMRMILGALALILYATLFLTILAAFYTLYGANNADQYTAFQTVVTILPTVLFVGAVFAFGMTVRSGYRARKSRRALR